MKMRVLTSALLSAFGLGQLFAAEQSAPKRQSEVFTKLANLPFGFEQNQGQSLAEFGFIGISRTVNVYLKATGARLDLPNGAGLDASVTLGFDRSKAQAAGTAEQPIPGFKNSYLIGNDRSKWVQGLSRYAKVRYADVWPGIDVVYYGNKQQLEYDFIVAPGRNPSRIRFHFDGVQSVSLNSKGDLEVKTSSRLLTQPLPDIYQEIAGRRQKVAGHYVLAGREISLAIGKYDRSQPLVIDPVLIYSVPNLPQSAAGYGIAIDPSLAAYAVGATIALPQSNGTLRVTAFLYKVYNSGAVQGFSFGGITGDTIAKAVAVDPSGNIYITGSTTASDLLSSGFQPAYAETAGSGVTDAFVVKFGPISPSTGLATSLFASYLGGRGSDVGNAIAVDSTGKIYVAGTTSASNFPITLGSAYRATGSTAFLTKIDPSFPGANDPRSLVYSELIGGTGTDTATSVAVDGSFNAYVAGSTTSTSASFQPSSATGLNPTKTTSSNDGYIVKVGPAGNTASYLTFIPTSPVNGITVGVDGFLYATGQTSGNLPNSAVSGYQVSPQGGLDAFLLKLNTTVGGANSLLYASYLGGSGDDIGYAVGVDQNGDASIVGKTSSANFPVNSGGFVGLASPSALPDAFVSRINTNVSGAVGSLVFSALIGGNGSDEIRSGVVDPINNVYVTGITSSTNFPATVAPLGTANPAAFASKLQVICASKVGVFRQGFLWVMDANGNTTIDGSGPGLDKIFAFGGAPGDIPVVGDWNGSGTMKAGVFRPNSNGQWLLDYNGDQNPATQRVYYMGGPGDIPVVGDWTGSGTSKIGLYRGGQWILDTNGNGFFDGGDAVFNFGGIAGDVPLTGDWTGSGVTKVGLWRQNYLWILDTNGNRQIDAGDAVFAFGGYPGDIPIVGDWNGTGYTKVGVWRQNFLWVLDANGDRTINPPIDFVFAYGGYPGDKPVTGCW